MCHTCSWPRQSSQAYTATVSAGPRLHQNSTQRRSQRSTSAPANGPSRIAGRPANTIVSVYWVTEWVCWSTQMLSAKAVRPEPISDTNWPPKMV